MAKLPDETFAFLVVHSHAEPRQTVHRITDFLNALEEAYNGLVIFDSLLEGYDSTDNEQLRRARLRDLRRFGQLLTTRESLRRAATLINSKSRLRVEAVEIGSPDFLSFIGKLLPFESIRKYLQDRHERRKDREYREAADVRKLNLDNEMKTKEIEDRELSNQLKQMEVFDKQIDIAKKLGATEEDFEPLLRNLLYNPLKRLEKFDDIIESVDVMTEADMRELPDADEPKTQK